MTRFLGSPPTELEVRLRSRLQPHLLDGTETINAIILMLQSPSRPADLRRALAGILANVHRDTVPIDTAIAALLEEIDAAIKGFPPDQES